MVLLDRSRLRNRCDMDTKPYPEQRHQQHRKHVEILERGTEREIEAYSGIRPDDGTKHAENNKAYKQYDTNGPDALCEMYAFDSAIRLVTRVHPDGADQSVYE